MTSKTLLRLYAEHTGKVSEKWYLYLNEFDRLFDEYREKSMSLLEIGVQNGGSLEIWSKYFSNSEALIGCDINPDCARLRYEDSRINVIVGDANSPDIREQITRLTPQFDIIIDDGSHRSSDIIKTFSTYFPLLADGGIFIVEDIHCNYWESFEGGLFDPFSAITFFKRLSDIINYEHWVTPEVRADNLRGFFWKYNCKMDDNVLSRVHSVEFINSLCVIRKASVAEEIGDSKYKRLLDKYRDEPIRLLEIGMQNGSSLEIWSKYFSQALMLIGCDINPDCAQLSYDDPRIDVIVGDANRLDVCEQIIRRTPQFDIIIDNGSHRSSDIIKTFSSYFPLLADGGIFIINDIHLSYGESFERAVHDPFSAVTFLNRLIDIINYDHWGVTRVRSDILRSIFLKYNCHIDDEVLSRVHSVEFINSLCVVRKALSTDNSLGRLIIAGDLEPVTTGLIQTHGVDTYSDTYLLDQTFNPWTRLALAEEELACTKLVFEDAEQQLKQITSSRSWKLTLPLRQVMRWITKRSNDIRK